MFLFLAAAAFLVCIDQRIIRQVNFISAVAAAVPYNRAAFVISSGWVARHQPTETLSGNVIVGVILFMGLPGTSGSPAGSQQASLDDTFLSARAFTNPLGSTLLCIVGSADDCQISKLPAGQIRGIRFLRPFFSQAATAD